MDRARDSNQSGALPRAERLREVSERLRAGVYDTGAIRDELAARLTDLLGDLVDRPKRSSDR